MTTIDPWFLGKSISIGLAVAAPVGPMSMLCIHRTLHRGRVPGLVVGAGIAAADFTFAAIAAFGLTAVASAILASGTWLRFLGSLLLIYMGIKSGFAKPRSADEPADSSSGVKAFATAYGLTMTNVPTVLFFAGIFASITPMTSLSRSMVFSAGVFAGSMLWWLALTTVISRFAGWLKSRALVWINRISGAVLVAFGCYGLFIVSHGS